MRRVQARAPMLGNEPVLRQGHAVDHRPATLLFSGPFLEIDRVRERRQQHELRERQVRLFGERDRRVEGVFRG
jgi:hypothetical protein